MRRFSRRDLLRATSAGMAAAGLTGGLPRHLRAQDDLHWGELPASVWGGGFQPKRVLELFLYGGVSIWENFWVDADANGDPNFRGFEAEMAASEWLCPDTADDRPEPTGTVPFGTDELGNAVLWGPATKPLQREDIFDNVRMVVLKHPEPVLAPHEGAAPLAVTGTRLGNPRHAGAGAAIERRNQLLAPRTIPYAYALVPDDMGVFSFVATAAVASGQHRGARPLLIRIGPGTDFSSSLDRGQSAETDTLIDVYRDQYRERLRWQGAGEPVRSAGFLSYDASVDALFNAADLTGLFADNILGVAQDPVCLQHPGIEIADRANRTATALDLARRLLTEGDARYVFVADGGLERVAGAPYDTHSTNVQAPENHVRMTSSNLYNALFHLARQIDTTGGNDPTKIDLSETMIVINTEFTREPDRNGDADNGREHYVLGYAAVLIGGPIAGRSIIGGMDNAFAPDANAFSPTDLRGGVFLAAGVDPFMQEIYGTRDMSPRIDTGDELPNMVNLKTDLLGVAG